MRVVWVWASKSSTNEANMKEAGYGVQRTEYGACTVERSLFTEYGRYPRVRARGYFHTWL